MKPDANQAIAILTPIRNKLGPQYLAYWVLPNVILSLSGARAYCDGVFWSNDQNLLYKWSEEIDQSANELKRSTSVVSLLTGIQSAHESEKYASFEIVLHSGLDNVLAQTKLLSQEVSFYDGNLSIEDIYSKLIAGLKQGGKLDNYSDENLHDVAFGILAGYPDNAISESVLLWKRDDPFMEPLIEADIRGASYYVCPQPVYLYPRHLVNDAYIGANERLWSKILSDYYNSSFHKSLEDDETFMAKMRELGNLR